jgi:hypothetical protein
MKENAILLKLGAMAIFAIFGKIIFVENFL